MNIFHHLLDHLRTTPQSESSDAQETQIVISRIVPKARMKRLQLTEVPSIAEPAAAIVMTSRPKIAGVEPGPHSLVLEFADVAYDHPQAMTPEQAAQAARFFKAHIGQGTILVACDNGQARSTAMAAALLRYLDKDDSYIWDDPHFRPNQLVFARMMKALDLPLQPGEIEALVARNEEAFHAAMVRGRDGGNSHRVLGASDTPPSH